MSAAPHYDSPLAHFDVGLRYATFPEPTPKKTKPMAKVKLKITRLTSAQVLQLATTVHDKLAPAAPATPPIPNMATRAAALLTKRGVAQAAVNAWEAGKAALPMLKAAKDVAMDDLRGELGTCAKAAELESGGDPVMLTGGGFDLIEAPVETTSPPPKVEHLAVSAGDAEGSVDGTFDAQENISHYEVECTTADPINGPWTSVLQPTASSFHLTGLTSGQRCWIRVRAHNVKGPGAWSDPATKIVP